MAKCNIDLVNSPYNNPDLKPFGYDPEKAKKLLDEAGWVVGADGIRAKDGVRLSLEMDTTDGSYLMDKEIAQVAVDYWKAASGPERSRLKSHELGRRPFRGAVPRLREGTTSQVAVDVL
jgi:hypothetical protein